MAERLQKLIAAAGLCSRRTAEEWITAGRVSVNGKKAILGDHADLQQDTVMVDGKPLHAPEKRVYLMLHKPQHCVTTMHDDRGRATVAALVKDCGARVYPVGRLDYESEGLLLMTNDGMLAFGLTHPRHEADKRYELTVHGDPSGIDGLSLPMEIDGYRIRPAKVQILSQRGGQAVIAITIHEGRNRQLRKMCAQCGLAVDRLRRVAMGTLRLDDTLAIGKWRYLTEEETAYLKSLAGETKPS